MRCSRWVAPVVAMAALSSAALAAPLATLYGGGSAADAGLVLGGWGSGSAKESKAESLAGSQSILVNTDGYYAGARIDFTKPADLGAHAGTAGVALRLDIKFPSSSTSTDNSAVYIPGGGELIAQIPMPGGPGYPPGPGYQPGAMTGMEENARPLTQALRLVAFGGGTRLVANEILVDPDATEGGWIPVVVPLAAFRAANGAAADFKGFRMNRLLVFGNTIDSFHIGQISIVQSNVRITEVSAGDEQVLALGETVSFEGTANPRSGLKFSWDFNSEDGIQEDATGRNVSYRYRKPGVYTVTLTVSDPSGVMKPVIATNKIEITG